MKDEGKSAGTGIDANPHAHSHLFRFYPSSFILSLNPTQAILIFVTGTLAGMINSVAGGGSFLTFPLLVYFRVPSIQANATSTVAIWPGSLASLGAYRREMAAQPRLAVVLSVVSIAGGAAGAWILLHTKPRTFDVLLPWLTLFATLLFAFGQSISARLKLSLASSEDSGSLARTGVIQFVIAIYGGYYGAGAGIMMLAVLALMGMKNIHEMNAFKTLLSVAFQQRGGGDVHRGPEGLLAAGVVHDGRGGLGRIRRRVAGASAATVVHPAVRNYGRRGDDHLFFPARVPLKAAGVC